jgi:hypothetical protein
MPKIHKLRRQDSIQEFGKLKFEGLFSALALIPPKMVSLKQGITGLCPCELKVLS